MNTPRKRRRYTDTFDPSRLSRTLAHGIYNTEYALEFAAIVTEFEHLESFMPNLLAALLDMRTHTGAGYVYRTLRNPSIRESVLVTLLERSPSNMRLGEEFDELLSDYGRARVTRNTYVHGLWFTSPDGETVYFARSDEDGGGYWKAEPEPIEKLRDLRALIASVFERVTNCRFEEKLTLEPRPARPPRSREPTATKRGRRRSGAESPEPLPQPSDDALGPGLSALLKGSKKD